MRSCISACWLVVVCTLSTAQARAESFCDPAVPRNEGRSVGYRERDGRCEGVYERQVSSFGVQLVSLTAGPRPADLCASNRPAYIVWAPPPATATDAEVRVTAESLRARLFYRLDTNRPVQSAAYVWPVDPRCSSEVRLGGGELGLLARVRQRIGARQADVLLPLGLAEQANLKVAPPYRFVLLPGGRVDEVYLTLSTVSPTGASTRLFADRPVEQGPYLPGQAIPIDLAAKDLRGSGLYLLNLSVVFQSGETDALPVFFLHDATGRP